MKKLRNTLFYLVIMGIFAALIFLIFYFGKDLEIGRSIMVKVSTGSPFQNFKSFIIENLNHSIGLLILQIITIIAVSRVFGFLFKKIGQPVVIGEILAGIVLGPSLLGFHYPDISNFLFPESSLGNLQILSQIGLVLFMFVIGMELNLKVLKNKAYEASVISNASIIFPFTLGLGLAYYIYPFLAPSNVDFLSFSLFIGISMSITAFPVLARIVQERGMHKTKLGALALICAAINDITAWCMLAAIIAIVKAGSFVSSIYTIIVAIAYVLFMIKVVRPFLKKIVESAKPETFLNKTLIVIVFLVLLISSFITETIGIHALFGAFLAGAIMPENPNFRRIFIEKIQDVALVLLLPLFFVISGLKTDIGLIANANIWEITGLTILIAITGKFLGSALAAKFVGQTWRDSLIMGTLMNTRGLMELIVLNIGYDLGILNAEIFAIMVIMALVTTFMTGFSLSVIDKIFKPIKDRIVKHNIYGLSEDKLLLFFRNPSKSRALLQLANSFSKRTDNDSPITAIHMTPSNGLHQMDMNIYEKESFSPITEEANELNRKLISLFKVSANIDAELIEVTNKGNYDLLLMDIEESMYYGSLLGKVLGFTTQIINPERLINTVFGKEKLLESSIIDNNTRAIVNKTNIPVGILINKNLKKIENIFIPIYDVEDEYLLDYAKKLIDNSAVWVSILNFTTTDLKSSAKLENYEDNINFISEKSVNEKYIRHQDLIIISFENYNKLFQIKKEWLNNVSSVLICSKGKTEACPIE
ncbi:MAG: cation:proton antiporter [Bacteroidales bacterium]|nr:cation:proton antiporter [Bacteroidales bacterium]